MNEHLPEIATIELKENSIQKTYKYYSKKTAHCIDEQRAELDV